MSITKEELDAMFESVASESEGTEPDWPAGDVPSGGAADAAAPMSWDPGQAAGAAERPSAGSFPGAGDDTSWLDETIAEQKPTVEALFPDWRDTFKTWPFVRLRTHPRTNESIILLGYMYRTLPGGSIRLDNSKIDGVVFSTLPSLCLPHLRSNDDDTFGVKMVVIAAKEGMRLTVWRNEKLSTGARKSDERHVELVVQAGKIQKYRPIQSK